MKLGLTLPNRQWGPYTDAELAALDDLAPSVVVWLLYGQQGPLDIDAIHQEQLRPFLDKHHPRILYRPYADNIPQRTPEAWAAQCYEMIQWMVDDGELIPANEMNLAVEHGFGEDWPRHIAWLRAFEAAWRNECAMPVHLPALSPSGRYLDGFAAYTRSGLASLFDVVDAHIYADGQALPGTSGKPLSITEFNGIDPVAMTQTPTGARECVWFLLGGTPDQSHYDLLKQPAHYASFKKWREPLTIPDFTSPNHDGPRLATFGVVIHATLGDSTTPQTEFDGTVSWFNSATSQVSAHAVVGPGGVVWRPVRTELAAWHCRASSGRWLGLEMCKPRVGDVIAPDILDAAAQIVAGWCHDFEIPMVWSTSHGLAEHREMPTNTDGHQDVGGPFDRADFLARVKRYAGQGDDLTNEQKTKLLDDLNILWGMTRADTIKANPAESERACHERIVAIKELLGVNG